MNLIIHNKAIHVNKYLKIHTVKLHYCMHVQGPPAMPLWTTGSDDFFFVVVEMIYQT